MANAEYVEEPATNVKFQTSLSFPGCSDSLTLFGTGKLLYYHMSFRREEDRNAPSMWKKINMTTIITRLLGLLILKDMAISCAYAEQGWFCISIL